MRTKPARINRFSQLTRALRVSRLLLWTIWVIYRERQRVVHARERGNYDVQPNIEVLIRVLVDFRKTALKLGVLMIKLGQFLSSRADLLPEQALLTLASLQDEVPPAPFEHIVYSIESELGKPVEELFTVLERKCTAAASLGQVHKATLASNGATVAVKVQRPNIEQLVRMDLSTLRFVIWVLTRFVESNFIDFVAFYNEFKRTVYEEIDYVREASNAKRFQAMFKDDPTIYIPQVYEDYVSRRVLILEWIDGIKINNYAELEAAGISRLEVAKRTVSAYFHQFFVAGFFHADPHPGNIFVLPGKKPTQSGDTTAATDGPIIAFVDFGMVGTINKNMKQAMKDVFLSFITRDSHALVNAFSRLGFIGEGANMTSIERGMGLMMQNYFGMTLGEVRGLDMPDVAQDVENLLYGQPFQVPAQFAFTGRAVSTLVGVSTGLAPEFNFVEVATPYARKFLGLDAGGIEQTIRQLLNQLLDTGRILLTLPRSLEQVLSKIDTGQIEVRLAGIGSREQNNAPIRFRGRRRRNSPNDAPANSGRSLTWAFMFVASLAAGVYLMSSTHQILPGWLCFGFAGLTALGLLLRG